MRILTTASFAAAAVLATAAFSTPVAAGVLALAGPASAVAATRGLLQEAATQLVITPADVTDELILRDGTRAYGRVESVDSGVVTFITKAGAAIQVRAAEIVSIRQVSGRVVAGEFRRADPNPTRLFFGPTGRSLKRGTGYLGVYEVLMKLLDVCF